MHVYTADVVYVTSGCLIAIPLVRVRIGASLRCFQEKALQVLREGDLASLGALANRLRGRERGTRDDVGMHPSHARQAKYYSV